MTGARVVDGDEDEDEQETTLGRSKLRAAAEGSFFLTLLNIWHISQFRFARGGCQVQGQEGQQEDLGPRS